MPPASAKANYKTYEAQARMVRAIVAAHPEVKWNYKEIAACYGSDMTVHALNHRFRKLKAQAVIISDGLSKNFDMKDLLYENDLPGNKQDVDTHNIAKYFGQSTSDGIQFQFRGIKKDADVLRQTEQNGGNVASCLTFGGGSGSATNTPSKPAPSRATPSSRGTAGRSSTARKRKPTDVIKLSSTDEDDDSGSPVDDWSEKDETPSKRSKVVKSFTTGVTPSRSAAARANIAIANATAQLKSSESPTEAQTPTSSAELPTTGVTPASIFGTSESKQNLHYMQSQIFGSGNPMVSGASTFSDLGGMGYFSSGIGYNDPEVAKYFDDEV